MNNNSKEINGVLLTGTSAWVFPTLAAIGFCGIIYAIGYGTYRIGEKIGEKIGKVLTKRNKK